MIKLQRPPEPELFKSPKIEKEILLIEESFKSSSQERLKFNTSVLIEARRILQGSNNHKCAYCESFVGTVSSMDLDHFRPKGGAIGLSKEYSQDHYFWLAYEWENLIIACQVCSRTKRNLFPIASPHRAPLFAKGEVLKDEQPLIINPYEENPIEFLSFSDDGKVSALNDKGLTTINVLALNRLALINSRKKAYKRFITELSHQIHLPPAEKKQFDDRIKDIREGSSEEEYCAVLRQALSDFTKSKKPKSQNRNFNTDLFTKKDSDQKPPSDDVDEIVRAITGGIKTPIKITYLQPIDEMVQISRMTIKSIEIANFKSISHLKLEILPSDSLKDRESWLLLLGDNGIGKSSILQAIALTLCGPAHFEALKVDTKDIYNWDGKDEGFVKVHIYEREDPYQIRFTKNEITTFPENAPTILLGYGATRLLPKGNLIPPSGKPDRVNIKNLFDYSVALLDAQNWLLSQSEENFETRIAPVLIDLLDLKGLGRITRDSKSLYVSETKLSNISDGYKSMIAMACDIMKTLSIEETRFHETQGVVLIDELGNHLHPRWRMKIVSALRLAFPKLQFIVSTHEPLCLRGLLHGEVVVLVLGDDSQILSLDKNQLPDHNLLKIDQLLTSDLFGLINTEDPETEKKYDEYYKLLVIPQESRTEEEKEKIAKYTAELSDKEVIGSTPQAQVIYELVNENFAKPLLREGFKTKESLKTEVLKNVKEIIQRSNIDWL